MKQQQIVKVVPAEPSRRYERPTLTPIGSWGPQVIALSLPGGASVPRPSGSRESY